MFRACVGRGVLFVLVAVVGVGCASERERNRLKDRTAIPARYETITVEDLLDHRPLALTQPGTANRARWSPEAREEMDRWERRAVSMEGYVVAMHRNPFDGDITLNITAEPEHSKEQSVVTEATPHFQELNPEWTNDRLDDLADRRARVRVAGWMFYDNLHAVLFNGNRGTLWEIHPITRLEVWDGLAWRPVGGSTSEPVPALAGSPPAPVEPDQAAP